MFYVIKTKECREKENLSFSPPQEPQTPSLLGPPGLPINLPRSLLSHYLTEFAQIHVQAELVMVFEYRLILCHLLSFPFVFSVSHHQGFFQRVSCLHQVTKVLELQQ